MGVNKIHPAEKLNTVHQIIDGKETQIHAAARLGVRISTVQQWISVFKSDAEALSLFLSAKQPKRPKQVQHAPI